MNQLKTSLKLTILLIVMVFMVTTGCQKEDDNHTENITSKNTGDVNAKLINLDELKQVQALKPHLDAIERTFDIHKAKQDAQSKIIATDSSFTILTDEILQVTTSYSEAYTFRIETPSHPEATFENFVIEKTNSQPYQFNIYSYVTLTINGKTNHYIIATTPVDSELINATNFQDLLNAKMQMIGGCLYNVDEVTGNAEPIWCFGTDGGSDGGDGGDGGDQGYNSCGDWTYFDPSGDNRCIRTRPCIDANGNNITVTELFGVTCPNGTYDGPDGSENGGDPNNGDIDDDPHWDDTDPIEQGGSGTGNTNNNPPPKGTLPFVPYDQQIIQCLGPQPDNDTATAVADWLDTASYLQIKNVDTYLDNNECSEEAKAFFIAVAEAGSDAEVDWDENIIYDPSLMDFPCQKEIIDEVINVCGPLSELFQNIFINSDEAQLIFKTQPLPILDGAFTVYAGANDNGILFKTTLNTTRLTNSTNLDIINIVVHEYTHAILMYFFYASPNFTIDLNNPPSYATLVEQFSLHRATIGNTNQSHHDYMASLVNDIAQICFNWCQQNNVDVSLEYLNKISWGGLTDTATFDILYPENTIARMEILDATLAEIFPTTPGYDEPVGSVPCD